METPPAPLPSSHPPTALIVVDMQQEFFSPHGMFKKKHLQHDSILLHLALFLSLFRRHRSPPSIVVWVRSIYLNEHPPCPSPLSIPPSSSSPSSPPLSAPPFFASSPPSPSPPSDSSTPPPSSSISHTQRLHSLMHGTHIGKRACCSPTASPSFIPFIPEIESLILPQDITITKNHYSSFNSTGLDEELRKRGIERVIISGVTATTCVFATAMNAKMLNYKEVIVMKDCVGYSSEKYAGLAYDEMKVLGISVVLSSDIKLE